MLFRRIKTHFKKQDWSGVALDLLVVVVGVFLGLQAANWNEERNDRAREKNVLAALSADLAETQEQLTRLLENSRDGSRSLRTLVERIDGNEGSMPLQELDRHVFLGLYLVPNFVPTNFTYEELLNTGRLDVITNSGLRQRLQRLSSSTDLVKKQADDLVAMAFDHSDRYLIEHYDFRGIAPQQSPTYGVVLDWVDPDSNRRSVEGIVNDPVFVNLALYRARLNQVFNRDAVRLIEEMTTIQQIIAVELSEG